MAERRMFARTIIDSDAFLDMPLSAQALYFHLLMRGDDEGFINNPKKIQRMIGATNEDFKSLVDKNFIILFESGIVVIKHWKIHNYIRGDRLKETVYQDERQQLIEKENGSYTLNNNIVGDGKETDRQKAYRISSLPYSFDYKIKQAFYNNKCPICGSKMERSVEDGIVTENRIPTIQHNLPISKGGEHELGNISVICKQCNITIQDKETEELNSSLVVERWLNISSGQVVNGCQSSVSQVSAQDRLGEDRIGKVSLGQEDEKPSSSRPDEKLSLIIKTFEQNGFGQLSQIVKDKLILLIDEYEITWINEAFKIAVENNKRTLKYVEGILRNWRAEGGMKTESTKSQKSVKSFDRKTKFHPKESRTGKYTPDELNKVADRKREAWRNKQKEAKEKYANGSGQSKEEAD